MTIELVTGHAGEVHVTSAQDGRLNAAAFGDGRHVLPNQGRFAITVDSATSVTVATGDAIFDGRHVTSESPTTLAVAGGTQGMNRIDTVAIVYAMDGNGVETATLQVFQGAETSGTAEAPALPSGSILDGDTSAAMPLWDLPLSGIVLGTPVQRFETLTALADSTALVPTDMTDYVVDYRIGEVSGTTEWSWVKYDSGLAIAWGRAQEVFSAATAWGSMYYSTLTTSAQPFTWKEPPVEMAEIEASHNYWLVSRTAPTTTRTAQYYCVSPARHAVQDAGYIKFVEYGRWK